MTTSAVWGGYCSIKIGSNEVAEMKSARIRIESNLIDVSNFDLMWEEVIRGQSKCTISGTFNFINSDTAQTAIQTYMLDPTDTALTVVFLLNSAGDDYYTASAHASSWELSGDKGSPIDGSVEFTVTGAVSREV